MDVVIMAGGRGSRLGGAKKPLLVVCGRRLVDVAIDVAKAVGEKVYLCSRDEYIEHLSGLSDVVAVRCPGLGYVEDLSHILRIVSPPVLVLPSDMPFLTRRAVESFVKKALGLSVDVVTLTVCKDSICRETGISLFKGVEGSWANIYVSYSPEYLDIDTPEDLRRAEELCASMEGIERLE